MQFFYASSGFISTDKDEYEMIAERIVKRNIKYFFTSATADADGVKLSTNSLGKRSETKFEAIISK